MCQFQDLIAHTMREWDDYHVHILTYDKAGSLAGSSELRECSLAGALRLKDSFYLLGVRQMQ